MPEESAASRLDLALVANGLARSRSHAATLIKEGRVRVDGRAVAKPAVLVESRSVLMVEGANEWVSRGALKLLGALDAFGIDVAGLTALDAGASTGGFTQVLLARGAQRVIAVDVGHGQLAPSIAADPRVTSLEGVNVRELSAATIAPHLAGGRIGLVVADLSFISLELVLPALVQSAPGAELVVLIKPQFEVGRTGVREGIVRNAGLRVDAIMGVLWAAHDLGLRTAGLVSSTIVGTHGNSEYLAHLSTAAGADPSEWSQAATELAGA